jgi:cellulose synthase/poly-beta-1,6-N-acetylglucosamine synthase-like glycosyltransferase
MIGLFWTAVIFLAYTFGGYFLSLWVVSLLRRRPHRQETTWPMISLVIAAHNEAGQIEQKIINSLELEYPEDRLEILVASDGSTDATPDIVRSFAPRGIKLIEIPQKRGKHYAQMLARDASRGGILVFSDASVRMTPQTLQRIASNFADPSVGCVSSEDHVVLATQKPLGEDAYVDFEMRLRRLESKINSLVSLSGSLFAARREVCAEWNPWQSSDFFLALNAVGLGLRAVVDPECQGWYKLVLSSKAEFTRKIRTIVHGLDVLFTRLRFLNPLRFGLFSWQLASHKLFRWLGSWALLIALVTNCFLWEAGLFYRVCLVGQSIIYGCGILGLAAPRLRRFKLFKLPSFFLMGNAASAAAWIRYCGGERFVAWQPTQRE